MKLFKMEKDKDYKKAKDTATAIVILLLAVGFILNWWDWCKAKPIRFLISGFLVAMILLFCYVKYPKKHWSDGNLSSTISTKLFVGQSSPA
jgi:RsiW-degrading membrane proteinase PrsW (M82 family)